MAYLDNTVITVDAVLTKLGRERLSQGGDLFTITQWAVSDDEVDYTLYNTAHPLGTDYYANAIENMPVLEALPDEAQSLRYKLYTAGTIGLGNFLPRVRVTLAATPDTTGTVDYIINSGQTAGITATTLQNDPDESDATFSETYTYVLFNERAGTLIGGTGADTVQRTINTTAIANASAARRSAGSGRDISGTQVRSGAGGAISLEASGELSSAVTTKLRVFGNRTGATQTISFTVNT
jgi:hypothetical protein